MRLFKALLLTIVISNLSTVYAEEYDFDKLNSGSEKVPAKEIKLGEVSQESKEALKRSEEEFAAEAAERERRAEESYKRERAERALGNGNRYYQCEYTCRTSGAFYDGTGEMKITVKADEEYEAKHKVENEIDEICHGVKGKMESWHAGESMNSFGINCKELQ
jgi:hypothetical protein